MKTIKVLLIALGFAATACAQSVETFMSDSNHYATLSYDEPTWKEGVERLCVKDQWLRLTGPMTDSRMVMKLIDAYNALMVFHSVDSDFQLFVRRDAYTGDGMLAMDLSVIGDERTRELADEFRKTMAEAQKCDSANVNEIEGRYIHSVLPMYRLETIMGSESVFDEEVYERTMNHDSLRRWKENKSFLEAIELAHDMVDGRPNQDALPKLVKVLTSGQYSPLIMEAWKTWRAMMADQMGHSKDSYIPNEEYNRLRRVACLTTLSHIWYHPEDWVAVNNFLLMASEPNVAIFGQYPFGNQSVLVFYEMFPEAMPGE